MKTFRSRRASDDGRDLTSWMSCVAFATSHSSRACVSLSVEHLFPFASSPRGRADRRAHPRSRHHVHEQRSLRAPPRVHGRDLVLDERVRRVVRARGRRARRAIVPAELLPDRRRSLRVRVRVRARVPGRRRERVPRVRARARGGGECCRLAYFALFSLFFFYVFFFLVV